MSRILGFALAFLLTGCSQWTTGGTPIMQTDPADPAGSASIGTGSVTSGGVVPPEAKAAGIGLSP